MSRIHGALGGAILAMTMTVAAAQGQPYGAWADVCEIDARTDIEACHADMTTIYRRNTVLISVGTDDDRPSVSVRVSDAEVRYGQMRVGSATESAEIICEALKCQMSYDDARAVIEAFHAADSAHIQFFTGRGETVIVRLPLTGFTEAYAAARAH